MKKGQVMVHSECCDWNSKGSCQWKKCLFSGSLKAIYVHSGKGSRSVPVDSLAEWLADEKIISLEFLKFSSGQALQHLACLNEDIALLDL